VRVLLFQDTIDSLYDEFAKGPGGDDDYDWFEDDDFGGFGSSGSKSPEPSGEWSHLARHVIV